MITMRKRAVCRGGILRFLGLGWTDHFFSNDYGQGDDCWRSGCKAQWRHHGKYGQEPVELPRSHDLEARRWQMPDGSIVGEAVNMEAVRLLRDNPDEYFRRTRRDPQHTEETK